MDNIGKFADSFGVHYYELANPKHPIPTFDQLPKPLRDYVKQLKEGKEHAKATVKKKEEDLVLGLANGTFLRTPRTAQAIADKLAGKLAIKGSRVAAIMRDKELRKLVKTIPGNAKDGIPTTYVLKTHYKAGD